MSKTGPAGTSMTWAQLWAIPRVPGDDDTDHIVRHAYGVDPDKEYRGAFAPKASAPARASKPSRSAAPTVRKSPFARATAARAKLKRRTLRVSFSKLVSTGVSEAPDSGVTISRLVRKHIASGKASSRHRLFGMPLVITTRGNTIRVAFAMEKK